MAVQLSLSEEQAKILKPLLAMLAVQPDIENGAEQSGGTQPIQEYTAEQLLGKKKQNNTDVKTITEDLKESDEMFLKMEEK